MKQSEEFNVGLLFQKEEFSLEEIIGFKNVVYKSLKERNRFKKELESFDENKPKHLSSSSKAIIRKGIGYWILNDITRAVKLLEEGRAGKEAKYFLALCYLETEKPSQAHDLFKELYQNDPDELLIATVYIESKIKAGEIDEAFNVLQKIKAKKNFRHNADIYFLSGLCLDYSGAYQEAGTEYQNALRINAEHQPSLFRMAYNAQLNGQDEEALELYQNLARLKPVYVNPMINLGLMYEDKGLSDQAIKCYERVLEYQPTHSRSLLYLKDASAAQSMFYDEEQKRRELRMSQILNTPLSDFQLSVRSRSCMNKLKVQTLGDLTRWTESRLLKAENFGMTSLAEVKELLARHSLTLAHEEIESAAQIKKIILAEGSTSDLRNKTIGEFEWSARVKGCLNKMKVATVGDLTKYSEPELLHMKNFGQTSLNEIKQKLALMGLSLKPGE
ncbi:MAG: DNA-directed RNA polymerase subunit alpha C-terminal domain-containing protein [Planctomycetota bacterium]